MPEPTLHRSWLAPRGVGSFLPPRRDNAWWDEATVDAWRRAFATLPALPAPDDPWVADAFRAALALRGDPFQGARERPIMPPGMTTADMEVAAAEAAFARFDLPREDVVVVLQHSTGDVHVQPPNAYEVHHRLGLPRVCLTAGVEAENDSFLVQLALAEGLLATRRTASGRPPLALLLQSSQRSHLVAATKPWAALVGDGATAVLVARDPGATLLAEAHWTESTATFPYTIGAERGPWWDGPAALRPTPELRAHGQLAVACMLQAAADVVRRAGLTAHIDTFLGHVRDGATAAVYQRAFPQARRVIDTFPRLTSLGPCNLPLAIEELHARLGSFAFGDTILLAGGIGNIASAFAVRWGSS